MAKPVRKTNNFFKLWKIANKKSLFFMQIIFSIGITIISIYISNVAKTIVDEDMANMKIISVLWIFLSLTVIGMLFHYLTVIVQSSFTVNFVSKLRVMLIEKMFTCKYGYFEDEHSGTMHNKLTYDMNVVSDYISIELPEFISGIITFICCLVYLLFLNWIMTLVVIVCIPISILLAGKISSPTYDIMDKFEHKMGEVATISIDTVKGAKIEKAYNLQEYRKQQFNKTMDEATSYYVNYEKLVAKAGPYKYLLKSAPMFICIIIGFYLSYKQRITNGEIMAFLLLLKYVSNPLSEFIRYATEYKSAKVSMDQVGGLLEYKDEQFGDKKFNNSKIIYEFKDMSFKYKENNDYVIKKLNLLLEKGKSYAFVGPSGCGKSTMTKLMLGFHIPTNGEINFNGQNLNLLDINEVRKEISYVSQSTYLFNGTVLENIGYGKNDATFEEIVEASKRAYAHDFICSLPEGYQTILSESGDNISGGQRQRIAIARAFLKDSPIFIFDEMTSALDIESEKYIQKAIDENKKDKTIVLIAHRLSTILDSDEILVFDNGNIIERGRHEELINMNGLYSNLYKINQSKEGAD